LVFGCLQSRKPLEARKRALESETLPGHRVSLEPKERKFLSLNQLRLRQYSLATVFAGKVAYKSDYDVQ